jgi:hypothetical protein
MLKGLKFIKLFCSISLYFLSFEINAQDAYKGNFWLFSYNYNLIIEDVSQFKGFFNGNKIVWNTSPFNFSAEKRFNKGKAFVFNVGSSLYPINQMINGITIKKPEDVFYTELGFKYNLNGLIEEDNKFDPFLEVNSGVWAISNKAYPIIGAGFGFNHWFSNSFGIKANFQYRMLLTNYEVKLNDRVGINESHINPERDGLLQLGLGIIHKVN